MRKQVAIDHIVSNYLGFKGSWRFRKDVNIKRCRMLCSDIKRFGEGQWGSGFCAGIVVMVFLGILVWGIVVAVATVEALQKNNFLG